jgi:hypothetical protein
LYALAATGARSFMRLIRLKATPNAGLYEDSEFLYEGGASSAGDTLPRNSIR